MAPIHNAARSGNLNRVKTLLDQGVPVNSRNEGGYTPLHFAVLSGNLNIVQELLKRGAHVNPRTRSGTTPLYLAVFWDRSPHIIHALIRAGANPKYRNMYGYDASIYSRTGGNAMKTSRAVTKWTKKTQNAANKRRQNAMRQVLGSVPVREGGSTRIGLPNNILRLIGSKIRRN